jgi:RNA polymerase sigma-70 factor (ECF subfamily)
MSTTLEGGTAAAGARWGSPGGIGTSDASGPSAEEGSLLQGLARGDRAAAERLVETTYRQVYGALFRLCGGDGDLAADLTQETYRKAWQALPRFEGRAQLSTWLYRIAYNTFLHHVRRPRAVQELNDETAARLRDPDPDPAESFAASDTDDRLRRAVLALPEELRFAVSAHFWSEVPVSELARLEGITTVGIRKRLKRAFALLKLSLEGEAGDDR